MKSLICGRAGGKRWAVLSGLREHADWELGVLYPTGIGTRDGIGNLSQSRSAEEVLYATTCTGGGGGMGRWRLRVDSQPIGANGEVRCTSSVLPGSGDLSLAGQKQIKSCACCGGSACSTLLRDPGRAVTGVGAV